MNKKPSTYRRASSTNKAKSSNGAPGNIQGQAAQPKPKSARLIALEVLVKVEEAGAYSNLQLNKTLQEQQLSRQDAALTTEIVYGTISRKLTIDYWLSKFVAKGLHKLQPWVHQLLRLSIYQLVWLDRIPPHAVVNEAVNIAKRKGHQGISSMVNGVLRSAIRGQADLVISGIHLPNKVEMLSVRYSFPEWLVKRWLDEYGFKTTEQILSSSNEVPHSSIRVNTMKATVAEVLQALESEGLNASVSPLAPAGINVHRGGHLAGLAGFASGQWSLQDESSMLVAEVLQPKPGMLVLDACAAPGGKSMHIGELMQGKGKLISNDLHEHKRQLIEDQAKRLGLTHIETMSGDAIALADRLQKQSFDAILLDAPCSGFGVIRRKPEIKWTKENSDVAAIATIQSKLLDAMSDLVKPGGTLVYSTCTIAKEENEMQIAQFLARNPQYKLDTGWPQPLLESLRSQGIIDDSFDGQLQLLPQYANSDGFFIARLVRHN
ncbi:16S rRNA (cytosine(967)-C(5))-methyltransferase RsmB [Paenibacillus endoradicis]|uniref:16S rRNA (cytosine(967)-C(5))-methyltransferase RsmB n=1 Tax=Paenibacillus endoradicis TaxID=2972487 RepID=UPI002159732B|nr:16S rRNA (cytosine(967)-C(5))-methyltransferase RsmB [Paenibacillus endoradicis]MCR8656117.1 16S rRNA (cytosine(967)-C(5))-methyltransferase RsmB [Paenibacillus endoradicis]MCR8658443.1 16S rRNA (cytosine(967)-C(5))-methyltransferase RsmB [Paenibacillus endoradicis]